MTEKADYDFGVDISAGRDETISAIACALKEEWDLASHTDDKNRDEQIYKAQKPSFYRAVFKAIPEHVEWTVTEISPGKSRVSMKYKLPIQYHLAMYIIMFIAYSVIMLPSLEFANFIEGSIKLVIFLFAANFFLNKFHLLWHRYKNVSELVVNGAAKKLNTKAEIDMAMKVSGQNWTVLLIPVLITLLFLGFNIASLPGVDFQNIAHTLQSIQGHLVALGYWSELAIIGVTLILLTMSMLCVGILCANNKYVAHLLSPCVPALILTFILFAAGTIIPIYQEFLVLTGLAHADQVYEQAILTRIISLPIVGDCMLLAFLMGCTNYFASPSDTEISRHRRLILSAYKKRTDQKAVLWRKKDVNVGNLLVGFWFCCLSIICWHMVIHNVSIVRALIDPAYGHILVGGAQDLAEILWGTERGFASTFWSRLPVILAVLPFGVFVLLHAHFWLFRSRRRRFTAIGGEIGAKVSQISQKIGVVNIICVLEEKPKLVTPHAEVYGILGKKRIVLSQRDLSFFKVYPQYFNVIIAHEVGHLKKHCQRIWLNNVLSRLALLPVGFLGMTMDSIKMEEEADDIARKYYEENIVRAKVSNTGVDGLKLKESISDPIDQAAKALEAYKVGSIIEWSIPRAAALYDPTPSNESDEEKRNMLERIKDNLRNLYAFYFELDTYHYLHRDAKLRRQIALE